MSQVPFSDFPQIAQKPELTSQINEYFNAVLREQNRQDIGADEKCVLKQSIGQFIVDCVFEECGANCSSSSV